MEGGSSENREENPMINSQMHSPFMPAFQHAQYPSYYQPYPGIPVSSSFPLYSHPPRAKRQLNKFTIFEKLQAIERVNCGETKAHVARSINVAESTLRGWFKNGDKLRTLYETEEMPMQAASKLNSSEYSISSMYNLPNKMPKMDGEASSSHMHQAKSFYNYNYSWLEFFRNIESLPLQYFDTATSSSKIDEGPEFGKKFLRWMEDKIAKGDKHFNIHMGHLEAFRSLLCDIFKGQAVPHPQERKHIVGDDEEKVVENVKVEKPRPVERKHIVGDEDMKDEPKSAENSDNEYDEDDEDEAL